MTTDPNDLPNLGLLIKLLKMTTSAVDGEALAAIRKANEQLVKFGGDWEGLLRGKVKIIENPFLKMERPERKEQSYKPSVPEMEKRPTPQAPPKAARNASKSYYGVDYASNPYYGCTVEEHNTGGQCGQCGTYISGKGWRVLNKNSSIPICRMCAVASADVRAAIMAFQKQKKPKMRRWKKPVPDVKDLGLGGPGGRLLFE